MGQRGLGVMTAVLALAAGLVVWALRQPNSTSRAVASLPWTVPTVSAGVAQTDLSDAGQGYAILPLRVASGRPVIVGGLRVVPAKGLVVRGAALLAEEAAQLLAAGEQEVPAATSLTISPANSAGSVFIRFSLGCRVFGPQAPYQIEVLFSVRSGAMRRDQELAFALPVNPGNRAFAARRLPTCQ
jgi:hypothetical protein